MSWRSFEDGSTINTEGSEGGSILRDDEHPLGSRITLECGATHAPSAITCGIYGWFFHTRFLGSEAEASYFAMRDSLADILDIILQDDDDHQTDSKTNSAVQAIEAFVARFP